ncbi:HlyC/CorC family transporter [Paracoccaceae bacterium]|nr:HlyC/CorC family transporter [Paracoccaceae bacterium]
MEFLTVLTIPNILTIIIIFMLLFLSGFFSGSETALTAASRSILRAKEDKGHKGATRALKLTENTEKLIGAILLGNNFANILAASLATHLLTKIYGEGGVFYSTLVMTLLIVIFAEVMPKIYAINDPERAALRVSPIIAPVVYIFGPITISIQWIVMQIFKLFGKSNINLQNNNSVQEEIVGAISLGHLEGSMEKEDKDRLLATLDLSNRSVEEIMLHRSEIEMIDADSEPEKILKQCLTSSYTRLPIFKQDQENIIGVMHAKSLLRAVNIQKNGKSSKFSDQNILDVAMKPYFILETTLLDDQLKEFLKRRAHFALVVDEYGALQGLLTLEDIIEEIVGEINDEHDHITEIEPENSRDGVLIVEGNATIRDLNRAQEWDLPDSEANTIAGLVIHEAQNIPSVGQVFSFHGFRIEIIEKKENRLTKLKINSTREDQL